LTTTIVAAHLVDTAPVVMDTAIEVLLGVAIMTMIVAATAALLHAVVPPLMTTPHPAVVALRTPTAAITLLLIHMPMAGLLMTDLLQETTLLEMPVMPIMIAEAATGNLSCPNQPPSFQLTLIDTPGSVVRSL
jgi:hypothetical protein